MTGCAAQRTKEGRGVYRLDEYMLYIYLHTHIYTVMLSKRMGGRRPVDLLD
jgi:hypothetical protein